MPSCLSMSAWSSRASWSSRARSSGLIRNGFAGAAGAAGASDGGAWAQRHSAGRRARAERRRMRRRFAMFTLVGVELHSLDREAPGDEAAPSGRSGFPPAGRGRSPLRAALWPQGPGGTTPAAGGYALGNKAPVDRLDEGLVTRRARLVSDWQQLPPRGRGAARKLLTGVVRPARFERATYRFVVCRSIQLSYGRVADRKL